MSNTTVFTNNQYYQDIASAIRNKNGQSTLYKPSEMAPAIDSLVVSGEQVTLQDKTVTPTTTTQTVSKDAGYTGLGIVTVNAIQTETKTASVNGVVTPTSGKFLTEVTVNVPSDINNQNKGITPTEDIQIITPDTGYSGLGRVTVEAIPSQYIVPTGTYSVTTNGAYDITTYASVNVDVPVGSTINNQNKTITPTEATQTVSADSGYTGLGTVTVNAISSTYVGTGITTNPSLTVSNNTVTAPVGYYSSAQSATIATVTQATPTIALTTTNGLISASATQSAGYVTAGTKTATLQLSIQSSTTITPGTSTQTAVAANRYTTGAITVAAVPTETKTVTTNGTVTPTAGKFLSSVTVSVPVGATINNQDITLTPSESLTTYTPESGYTGFGTVTVKAISSTYIGSDITIDPKPTVSGDSVTIPEGYYSDTTTKTVASITQATPAITVSSNGLVTATATQSAGYVTNGTKTATLQLSTQSATTIIPNSSAQTAVAAGKYTTGAITVAAVPAQDVTYTSNGTYTVTSGYISTVTVSVPSDINNQAKTVTPTEAVQTITPDSNYSGLSTVTVNAIPSDYIIPTGTLTISANGNFNVTNYASTTVNVAIPDDTTATAAELLYGKTAYIDGAKTTGTMTDRGAVSGTVGVDSTYTISAGYHNGSGKITGPTLSGDATVANVLSGKTFYSNSGTKQTGTMANNGALGTTLTSQSASYTIPAGYTSGGTVTVSLPVLTLSTDKINGTVFEETSGSHAWRTTVQIPEGYYGGDTITKEFLDILPELDTPATASEILWGYESYNGDGEQLTGTMSNNGAWSITLDHTTTTTAIPAGYHNGSGTVSHTTVNIPDPTISIGSSGLITASGSWTRGYTTDNSYTKTLQLTTQSATTIVPTESAQTAVAAGVYTTGAVTISAISSTYVGSGITQRDSDDLTVNGATVTAPAGYYSAAASKSVASMTLPTSASSSATSGATNKAIIGRSTSNQYINIPTGYNSSPAYYTISAVANGSVTAPSSISGTNATLSTGDGTLTLNKTISVTPDVTSEGYISSGTAGNSSVSLTASVTTQGATTYNTSSSNQTIAAGTYLTGEQTIRGVTHTATAAKIAAGQTVVIGDSADADRIASISGTFTADATATASDILTGETAYVNGTEITGTLVVNKYYTGSSTPASSLGNDGDIYLQA